MVRGRLSRPLLFTGALANPGGGWTGSATQRAWLKKVQMAGEMRRGLGFDLSPVPQTALFATLHAHLGGDCATPAPTGDALSALRAMRCRHGGKNPPPVAAGGSLDASAQKELEIYFAARLAMAGCEPARCFVGVVSALEKLGSGYTKEDLVARWLARYPATPPEQFGPVLGAMLSGRTPDRPRPEIARRIEALTALPPMPPMSALGLLRYAEKQLSAEVGVSAARLASRLNVLALADEGRSFFVVYAPGDSETELALRALAQGGAVSRKWFSKALYRRCRGMIYAKRFEDAIACFKVVEAQNEPDERDLSIWFQGKSAFLMGQPELARKLWTPLWQTGKDDTGAEAAMWMGRFDINKGAPEKALALAKVAEARFSYAPHTGDLLAMLARKPQGARRLQNLWRRHPHSLGVAGLLEREGVTGPKPLDQLPPLEPQSGAARAAHLLLLAGEPAAAAALLQLAEGQDKTPLWRDEHRLLLAWCQAEWKDYLASVKTLELLWWQKGYSPLAETVLFQSLLYPLYFLPQARQAAADTGIPPAFLYGIVRQESRFMHRIRSRSGAIGLSQIMPSTGQQIAGWLNEAADYTPESLDDPGKNLRYGGRYLAYLKEKFGPDNRLMSAGYNGGPGNVSRWLNANGYENPWNWVEQVPLEETRDYAKKVVHNAWMYNRLYPQLGCGDGVLCRVNWR